jgi:hypothetical protein
MKDQGENRMRKETKPNPSGPDWPKPKPLPAGTGNPVIEWLRTDAGRREFARWQLAHSSFTASGVHPMAEKLGCQPAVPEPDRRRTMIKDGAARRNWRSVKRSLMASGRNITVNLVRF